MPRGERAVKGDDPDRGQERDGEEAIRGSLARVARVHGEPDESDASDPAKALPTARSVGPLRASAASLTESEALIDESVRSCPPLLRSRGGEPRRQTHQVEERRQHSQLEEQAIVACRLGHHGDSGQPGKLVPVRWKLDAGTGRDTSLRVGDGCMRLRATTGRRFSSGRRSLAPNRRVPRCQQARGGIGRWSNRAWTRGRPDGRAGTLPARRRSGRRACLDGGGRRRRDVLRLALAAVARAVVLCRWRRCRGGRLCARDVDRARHRDRNLDGCGRHRHRDGPDLDAHRDTRNADAHIHGYRRNRRQHRRLRSVRRPGRRDRHGEHEATDGREDAEAALPACCPTVRGRAGTADPLPAAATTHEYHGSHPRCSSRTLQSPQAKSMRLRKTYPSAERTREQRTFSGSRWGRSRWIRRGAMHVALRCRFGPLAQLVEQGTFNPKVVGSIPTRPIRSMPGVSMRFGRQSIPG